MDIFEELEDQQLQDIAGLLEEQRVPADTVLFREGDVGDSMLIVTAGRIRLTSTDPSGRERVLAVFGDGEFFGEMGVLTGEPRTGNAVAEVDSGVLVLPKSEFDRFLSEHPTVMRSMLKVIAQRQMAANARLVEDDDEGASTKKGAGQVLVVYSPRGGGGKTTIATNIAVLLAKMFPDRVALLDLAVTFSHDCLFLGIQPVDALSSMEPDKLDNLDRETLNSYAHLHSTSLRVFTGAIKPEEGESVTGEHVKAVLATMKRQYIFVVVDLPSNFNEPTLAAIEMADRLVLVMTPELANMRDSREVLRLFNDTIRVPKEHQYLLLNNPHPSRALNREQLETSLELQVQAEIPNGGEAVYRAYVKGTPLVLSSPGSPVAKAIEKATNDLIDGTVKGLAAASQQPSGLLGKLFSRNA
jgi:pilus assembly protein CpaE